MAPRRTFDLNFLDLWAITASCFWNKVSLSGKEHVSLFHLVLVKVESGRSNRFSMLSKQKVEDKNAVPGHRHRCKVRNMSLSWDERLSPIGNAVLYLEHGRLGK